jgi:hypothetical protein
MVSRRGTSVTVCATLLCFVVVAGIFFLGSCPLRSVSLEAGSTESKLRALRRLTVCHGELLGSSLVSSLTPQPVACVGRIYFLLFASSLDGSPHVCVPVSPATSGGNTLSPKREGGREAATSLYKRHSGSVGETGACEATPATAWVCKL